jgi:hypothetical protein
VIVHVLLYPVLEEHALLFTEIKLLEEIFGPKQDEVSERFMISLNEERCDVYRSPCDVNSMKCTRL